MPRTQYTVDYHLICVIYLSDRVPSSDSIAQLWTALAALGDLPVESSIFCNDGKTYNLADSVLGSFKLNELLLDKADEVISVGASSFKSAAKNAVLDSDVNFGFGRNQIWDGQQGPAVLYLSISGQIIDQAGLHIVVDILRQFFNVADSYSPIYGLVDLARPDDAFAGMIYGAAWPRTASLARWVEQMNWVYSGAVKEDRLRGLYWGNYLSRKHLNRLGGRDKFLATCAKNARNYDGSPNAHIWDLPNGCFVSLSYDPIYCRPGCPMGIHPAAEANLKWLIRELGTSGVLNLW